MDVILFIFCIYTEMDVVLTQNLHINIQDLLNVLLNVLYDLEKHLIKMVVFIREESFFV